MNQRPSRVPSPGQAETTYAEPYEDAAFAEDVARANLRAENLPANRLPETEMHSSPIMSVRDEVAAPREPITNISNLVGAIAAVMAEIQPVEKGGWNKFHSYAYARIQDLLGTLTPLMGKHGIVIFQNEEGRELFDGGKAVAVRYRFTVAHKSGEIWPDLPLQTGVSNCRDTKGGFDDKAINKCHTAARKYFLLSLFQIPTDDMADADAEGRPPTADAAQRQPRPQGRRQVPSPNGKLAPHILPVIDGEQPQAWTTRFGAFVAKAESKAEIDQWYAANEVVFAKLKAGNFMQVYNDAIDFMDACEAKLATPNPDPISSGPSETHTSSGTQRATSKPASGGDFPGDTKMKPNVTQAGSQAWLDWLDEAFAKCTDTEELASEQESIMLPSKDSFSEATWRKAVKIVKKHLERIQNG